MKRPIVGVMGSGSEAWGERAEPLGRWLAGRGVHLLTGGGQGVMASVSQAFHDTAGRDGLVIGVLPCGPDGPGSPRPGYPNAWVELPIRTHLPLSGTQGHELGSRNAINVLTADVVVALPGSAGTRSEVELAVRHGRPVVAWADASELPVPEGVTRASSLEEVTAFMERQLAAEG